MIGYTIMDEFFLLKEANMVNEFKITINGKTQNLKEWCKEFNLNYGKVKSRVNRSKWSIEQALELVPPPKRCRPIIDRIYEKTICDIKTRCWNWTGCLINNGYGQTRFDNKKQYVHRIIYQKLCGPIPEDKPFVLHKCDNRKCCNPKHLYTGTSQNNSDDMVKRCRSTAGEKNINAKLTEKQIIEIRASKDSQRIIAKRFRVSYTTIQNIRRRKTWKHI